MFELLKKTKNSFILLYVYFRKVLSPEKNLSELRLQYNVATPEDALFIYKYYQNTEKNLPLSLEKNILETILNEYQDRLDLSQRLKYVNRLLSKESERIKNISTTNTYEREDKRIRKPVFIVGCGRSGTTILFRLLSSSDELIPTDGYPDGEDHIGWLTHGGAIISGLGDASINNGIVGFNACLSMDASDVNAEIINQMHNYYYYDVLAENNSKRVINKCPHLSNKIDYVLSIFPDAKIIHIIRDAVPVISSWIQIMKSVPNIFLYLPEGNNSCFWSLEKSKFGMVNQSLMSNERFYSGSSVAVLADYWNSINENLGLYASKYSEQFLTVRYEDLCNDQDSMLNVISRFAEIEYKRDIFLNIPLQKDTNSKYVSLLSREDREFSLRKTEKVRKQYGYIH